MTACRRQNQTRRTASSAAGHAAARQGNGSAGEPAVRRYAHPIQTARPVRRSQTEIMLGQILEALSRQAELLEELLRRTGGNSADTK